MNSSTLAAFRVQKIEKVNLLDQIELKISIIYGNGKSRNSIKNVAVESQK